MQYLFGIHPVMEAVKAGKKFDKVLLKQGMEGSQYGELMSLLKQHGIQYQFVPVERLNRTIRGAHQGVIAYISKIDYVPYEELIDTALATNPAPMIVILDGVSDVRNLGAIARTLECAGGSGIILPAKGGAAINAEAIKASAGEQGGPETMLFDEIDAGLGGNSANAVGDELRKLSENCQIIAITHLPQIAVRADSHYLVEKRATEGRTVSSVRKIDGEDREKETARLLSGSTSGISLEHARSLLEVQH